MPASFLAAFALILLHLFAGTLRFLDTIPRSRWLSAAGGVSVAYVFVHLLPELSEAQEHFDEGLVVLGWLERHVYLIALAGLSSFYGLERLVRRHRHSRREEHTSATGVFALHLASFAIYNALIGYVLATGEQPLFWFAVAMALHFLVTDYGLRHDHPHIYNRWGRWIVSLAIGTGWLIGVTTALSEPLIAGVTAFVGGGVILNVLKEELPEERESRFWAFLTGAATYAALLLLT